MRFHMNRKLPLLRSLAVVTAVAVPSLAQAQSAPNMQVLNGLYFGIGGGWVHYNIDYTSQVTNAYDFFLSPFVVQYADFGSNNKGGFKTWLGYQFVPWLAAEVAYVNLDSPTANYSVRATSGPSTNPNTINAQYKIQGMNLSAVGTLPINEMWSVHGMVGAFYSEYKYSESGTNADGSPHSFNASNLWQWNLSYGAGVNFNFNKQWSIRADWDRFEDIGNTFQLNTTGNGKFDNIDLFTFNVVYRF